MPKRSVGEDCHATPHPSEVGTASYALRVYAPTANASCPKRAPERDFGQRVTRSHTTHQLAALRGAERVCHATKPMSRASQRSAQQEEPAWSASSMWDGYLRAHPLTSKNRVGALAAASRKLTRRPRCPAAIASTATRAAHRPFAHKGHTFTPN